MFAVFIGNNVEGNFLFEKNYMKSKNMLLKYTKIIIWLINNS